MDSEMIYSILGVLIFIMIVVLTLRSDVTQAVQSKEEKRYEIVNVYKKELNEALAPLGNDTQARIDKKSELLKKFSDELSVNIFFDSSEIRDIILDLSVDS